jgi:hypothetical protein
VFITFRSRRSVAIGAYQRESSRKTVIPDPTSRSADRLRKNGEGAWGRFERPSVLKRTILHWKTNPPGVVIPYRRFWFQTLPAFDHFAMRASISRAVKESLSYDFLAVVIESMARFRNAGCP